MDKQSLILILKECFKEEENGAYLHLIDGSTLLINEIPSFNNLHFQVENKYTVNLEDTVEETICIPYSSVNYITLTNSENLRIISKQYEPLRDDDLENIF